MSKLSRRGMIGAIGAAVAVAAAGPMAKAATSAKPARTRPKDLAVRVYTDAKTGDTILSARLFVYEGGGVCKDCKHGVMDASCPEVPARFGVIYKITEDARASARDSWRGYLTNLRQHAADLLQSRPAHLRTPSGGQFLCEDLPIWPYEYRKVGWDAERVADLRTRA